MKYHFLFLAAADAFLRTVLLKMCVAFLLISSRAIRRGDASCCRLDSLLWSLSSKNHYGPLHIRRRSHALNCYVTVRETFAFPVRAQHFIASRSHESIGSVRACLSIHQKYSFHNNRTGHRS